MKPAELERLRANALYLHSSRACLSAAVAFVVAGFFLEKHGGPWFWAGLINAPLVIYPFAASSFARGEYRLLYRYAESAYFIGYTTTIVSLLGVAFRLGITGDIVGHFDSVLINGAQAVSSTVIGLVGMFWLRTKGQTFEDGEIDASPDAAGAGPTDALLAGSEEIMQMLEEKSRRIAEALDRLLAQFESRQAGSIAQVSDAAGKLAQNLQLIDREVGTLTRSVQTLEPKLGLTGKALEGMSTHASALHGTAEAMTRTAGAFGAAAEKIKTETTAMGGAAATVEQTTTVMAKLRLELDTCGTRAGEFSKSVTGAQTELARQIDALRERADGVGRLSDEVGRFVTTANEVARPVNLIVSNLESLVKLSDRLGDVAHTLVTVKDAFAHVKESVQQIQSRTVGVSNETERLVSELNKRIHDLERLAIPLAEFGKTMEGARPHLQALRADQATVLEIGAALDRLPADLGRVEASAAQMLQSVGKSATQMLKGVQESTAQVAEFTTRVADRVKEIDTVAENIAKTAHELRQFT